MLTVTTITWSPLCSDHGHKVPNIFLYKCLHYGLSPKGGEQYSRVGGGGQVMWVGCKLQSVLKSLTVTSVLCTLACKARQYEGGLEACPHRNILRFGCFEIESESIFSGTCVLE